MINKRTLLVFGLVALAILVIVLIVSLVTRSSLQREDSGGGVRDLEIRAMVEELVLQSDRASKTVAGSNPVLAVMASSQASGALLAIRSILGDAKLQEIVGERVSVPQLCREMTVRQMNVAKSALK
jgi:hypothetical protein